MVNVTLWLYDGDDSCGSITNDRFDERTYQKPVKPPYNFVSHSIILDILFVSSIIPNKIMMYPAILERSAPYFASERTDTNENPRIKNGMAKPIMYERISGIPLTLFVAVMIRTADKIGPMHGDHPAAKLTPTSTEPK